MEAIARNFHTLSYDVTVLAVGTMVTMLLCRTLSSRIPGPIVAMLAGTAAVFALKLPVETIGTRFGGIPSGLPHFAVPHFHSDLIHGLLGPAFTVAMLGAIESLMSAVVADRMSHDHHNPNVELVAQGVANVVSPFFGGLPATGAIGHRDQHPGWCQNTSGRNDSRSDTGVRSAFCCSAHQLHSHGSASRNIDDCGLQHGRVA